MSTRTRNIFDMFVATHEFGTANAADFASLPEAATQLGVVQTAINALQNHFAAKTSGERGAAVESKAVTRLAIRRKMKDFSRTARALNISDAGFRRLFRIPDSNSDQSLIASAREFVEEAGKHSADFARLGIPATLASDLENDIAALEDALNTKLGAHAATIGATAGIDDEIERGMAAETVLDAIMKNVYRSNPVKLAQWKSARHVRRTSGGETTPTPAPPNPA